MTHGATVERQGGEIVIKVRLELKKRSGRKEVILPGSFGGAEPRALPQEPLVRAVARAHRWEQMIEGGQYRSIPELAKALRADRSYVRRILTLATLAPDIVQVIVDGREPSGLSLERLVKGMPLEWEAQRQALGLPTR